MIRAFRPATGPLAETDPPGNLDGAVWIDLLDPSPQEAATATRATGLSLPTRAEMAEIEPSSRLYRKGGTVFLTALLPAGSEAVTADRAPVFAPVTFALGENVLVTLRYHDPQPFGTFPARADQTQTAPDSPRGVLLGLLDEIVDRIADLLERAGSELDALSRSVFAPPKAGRVRSDDFQQALTAIGRQADFVARLRFCLVSLERLLSYLSQGLQQANGAREDRAVVKTQLRDVIALTQHADALTQQATLLLDATLGLINIEQSNIIKVFSVVAFVMLPPTLIASVYGMNFEHMPELRWRFGYPLAVTGMVLSAVLPYLFFKRKGWL